MSRPRVVIIGGGFGGLYAARALAGAPVDVLLIDRTNHHLFQPLLYQVATTALAPSDVTAPIRWILRRQRNVTTLLGTVDRIDRATRTLRVLGEREPISYDFLIVAPGARHAYFGHPEWEEWAPGLKNIEDARRIRKRCLIAFERAERIRSESVFWAAGNAASPLGRALGVPLDRAGRIAAESDLTLLGDPRVVVVGDLAAMKRESGDPVPAVAPAAMQMGTHAAKNIRALVAG